jgi:glycosyltransferase involved in cell wall biosynthesis
MSAKRIVLATDAAFLPPYQGDAARLCRMISFLRARGWSVTVVHFHDRAQRDVDYVAMSRMVERLVVYYPSDADLARRDSARLDDWCPEAFVTLVRDACRSEPTTAVLAQFVFLSRCLSAIAAGDGICRVLDADNIFAGRREAHLAAGTPYSWFSTSAAEERTGWARADLLLSVQEHECRAIGEAVPGRPVILTPYAQDVVDSGPGDGRTLFFVGADNEANAAGLRAFVADALPVVRRRHPTVRLMIAGRVGEHVSRTPGVEAMGVVADLGACYRAATVALNLMPCGTGLKTKTIEALCHGKCLVTTAAGIQGLEHYPHIYRLVDSPGECGDAIADLLDQPAAIERLRTAGHAFARRYFAAEVVFGRLEAAVLAYEASVDAGTPAPRESQLQ